MSDDSGPSDRTAADASPWRRRGLTLLLLLHWGAVAAFILPATREALEPVPAWIRPAVAKIIPPVVRWTSPVTQRYWNLTATRQTWTLFAPYPADWSNSIRVVPYFAVEGRPDAWVGDTLALRGPERVAYPHMRDHRSYRILWNLGYDVWGDWYRPLFARELCRSLQDERGRSPAGVLLLDRWTRITLPWGDATPDTYDQRLGGFGCDSFTGDRKPVWAPYGLPGTLDTRGWPEVGPRADTAVDRAPIPGQPGGAGVR